MDKKTNDTIPWELITQSLTDSLSVEEELKLQRWLSISENNRKQYEQISKVWKADSGDYKIYKEADENASWQNFQHKIKPGNKVIPLDAKERSKNKGIRYLVAFAAVFAGLLVLGILLFKNQETAMVYETKANARKVMLKDGSSITLQPNTKIEIDEDYNVRERVVVMVTGEAVFNVIHRKEPFIVQLGETRVVDIGTVFIIQKGEKEISVAVTSGSVEFSKTDSKETKSLSAGNRITYDIQKESFGEISSIDVGSTSIRSLNFENTPLSDVIASIQQVHAVKIVLTDEGLGNRRITAHLEGMPKEKVIEVVCKTLGLEYTVENDTYKLKARK